MHFKLHLFTLQIFILRSFWHENTVLLERQPSFGELYDSLVSERILIISIRVICICLEVKTSNSTNCKWSKMSFIILHIRITCIYTTWNSVFVALTVNKFKNSECVSAENCIRYDLLIRNLCTWSLLLFSKGMEKMTDVCSFFSYGYIRFPWFFIFLG